MIDHFPQHNTENQQFCLTQYSVIGFLKFPKRDISKKHCFLNVKVSVIKILLEIKK